MAQYQNTSGNYVNSFQNFNTQNVGFWNANGILETKTVNINFVSPEKNRWFTSFNKPNSNYNPYGYRAYMSFYNAPFPYMSNDYNTTNNNSVNWLSPPHTYKKLKTHNQL